MSNDISIVIKKGDRYGAWRETARIALLDNGRELSSIKISELAEALKAGEEKEEKGADTVVDLLQEAVNKGYLKDKITSDEDGLEDRIYAALKEINK